MKIKTLLCFIAGLTLVSCGKHLPSDGMEPKDFAKALAEFIDYNGYADAPATDVLTDEVDLYIDYSTCVAEARNSAFYRTVHPVIVDSNPNYYSIKGKKITFETNNRQMVYQLLNTVQEVNFAEIKGAIDSIVHHNRHAVLITDGEYFMQNGVRDNLNNPYIADEFRVWLRRGFDIYIYCEPYLENNRFNKYRYYFFFTDDRVENNIRDRFDRSMPAQNDVKMFHLSGKRPAVVRSAEYPVINVSLSPNTMLQLNGPRYDLQEYYTQWNKIYKYLLDNAYSEKGEPLENGDYVVRGLFVDNSNANAFKVSDIEVKTYNIGDDFEQYQIAVINAEENEEEETVLPKAGSPRDLKLFMFDRATFEKTGEIVLLLDKENRYEGLTSNNLLKVDIVANKVEENFTQNNEINDRFQWQSIAGSQAGQFNTSLYESIRQVLLDPAMNPTNIDGSKTIYTIYMSTYGM